MQKILIMMIVAFGFATCTKEEVSPREYPRVLTQGVTAIDNTSAKFEADLTAIQGEIIDHGFIWSENGALQLAGSDKISLGKTDKTGSFQAICDRGLTSGKTYFMRSYVRNRIYTVYGNVVSFIAKGSKPPVLKDFYPALASWNETITLIGENFSAIPYSTVVEFGGVQTYVIDASADTLHVSVPSSLGVEFSTIKILRADASSTITKTFQLQKPVIESVSPASGTVGTIVTVTGKYMSSARTKISFKGKELTPQYVSSTSIKFTVRDSDLTGTDVLKVEAGSGNLFATFPFEIN